MAERIDLFLFLMAGAGLFGLTGAVFGGVAGRWFRRDGKAAGAFVGPLFVRLIEHIRRDDLTPSGRAVVGGAVEGGVFLGLIGGLAGSWAQQTGQGWLWLLAVGGVVALLAAAAVLFGVAAYGLVGIGVRASGVVVTAALAGGLAGAVWGGPLVVDLTGRLGIKLNGSDPLFAALAGGAALGGGLSGLVVALARRRPRPAVEPHEAEE